MSDATSPDDDVPTPDDQDQFFAWVARRAKEIAAERLREIQSAELPVP